MDNPTFDSGTYGYGIGPKPIIMGFSGMNIHLLAILGFISCQGFDP